MLPPAADLLYLFESGFVLAFYAPSFKDLSIICLYGMQSTRIPRHPRSSNSGWEAHLISLAVHEIDYGQMLIMSSCRGNFW